MASRFCWGCALLGLLLAWAPACKGTPYREVEVDLAGSDPGPSAAVARDARTLRFSIAAMQSPRSTHAAYSRLFSRVSQLLGMPVELVQRRTYREVNDLLLEGRLDAALICTGGYLELRRQHPGATELIAVPVTEGKTTYHSLVIVPGASAAQTLEDLRGARFAFTDELSLSGRAYVVHALRTRKHDPTRFFAQATFTRSHDQSIEAVESGLADGAAVDSLIYEGAIQGDPQRAAKTRVIDRSPPLGMMPVVASTSLAPELRGRLRQILLELHRDVAAAAALRITRIERFEVPAPGLYEGAERLVEAAR